MEEDSVDADVNSDGAVFTGYVLFLYFTSNKCKAYRYHGLLSQVSLVDNDD